jgi:NADH pyrophosphatase NudC (nudix superfamily)
MDRLIPGFEDRLAPLVAAWPQRVLTPTMSESYRYCPRCAAPLRSSPQSGRERPACPVAGCGYVQWGNPLPVVAAIVEHEGKVLLARGRGWPEKVFGLVTGFLEAGEAPEAGCLREVKEELDLDGTVVSLVGVYPFEPRNEVIIAYHVRATGVVRLSEELEGYKALEPERVRSWPFGTGLALQAWLDARARPADGGLPRPA